MWAYQATPSLPMPRICRRNQIPRTMTAGTWMIWMKMKSRTNVLM